jgi:hypothetical protein
MERLEEKLGMATDCFGVLESIAASLSLIASGSLGSGGNSRSVACGCEIPSDGIIGAPSAPELGDPQTDPPPDGFDTWNEYYTYKCKAANKIIDDLITTCNNLSSIPGVVAGMSAGLLYLVIQAAFFGGGAVAIAEGLIALGLASAAGVAIAITALVAIILAGIGGLAYFTALASALGSDKENLVCDLYGANSVEEARALLFASIDEAIATLGGIDEFTSDQLNAVVTALLGTAVFNTLFEYNGSVSGYVGSVVCGDCDCSLQWGYNGAPIGGEGDLSLGGSRTVTSTVYSGNGLHYITFTGDCTCDGQGWNVTVHSMTGYTPYDGHGGGDIAGQINDCANNTLWTYGDQVAPSGSYCGNLFQLGGQTDPFSASISIDRCQP